MRLSLICESCRTRQNLFVPNPDLRPEKTKTAEAGARLKFDNALREMDALRVKAGYCNTRATDYLDTVMTITNPATLRRQHHQPEHPEGGDLRRRSRAALRPGLSLRHPGLCPHRGDDETTGRPLDTIPA